MSALLATRQGLKQQLGTSKAVVAAHCGMCNLDECGTAAGLQQGGALSPIRRT